MKKLLHSIFLILCVIPFLVNALNAAPGAFKGIVYVDVAIDQPNVEDCYTTSVPESTFQNGIKVFPNPNQGIFNLELTHENFDKEIKIYVFDALGKRVYQSKHHGAGEKLYVKLDLAHLPKGIYYIWVQADKQTGVEQLILF